MEQKHKTAVVLFNLGGPDGLGSVKPFLFNLFNDKAIIGLPNPLRFFLAKWISSRRAPVAQEIYEKIGGKSPLLEQTQLQAEALERKLFSGVSEKFSGGEYKIFISMRYWHPMSDEVAQKVKKYDPDRVVLLPLYPQFSTTTTGSSLEDWRRAAKKYGITAPVSEICCYPSQDFLISAHSALLKNTLDSIPGSQKFRVLFSAHGLPEKIIQKGDPYQWQVEKTVEAIVKKSGIEALDYQVCYQSRVGPLKWIGPSTEEEIFRAGKEKISLVVVPVAFVSEHSETLVELDIEYRHLAEKSGVADYFRVPTLMVQHDFITALSQLCTRAQREDGVIAGDVVCPSTFAQCPKRMGSCHG